MDYGRIKTEYLCYLMNRVQIDAEGPHGYSKLCEKLLDTEFLPFVSMDENRSCDCRYLRRDYAEGWDPETGDILDRILPENGTMMELLVTLSEKMNYDLADSQFEAGTGKWFKEMLINCGLIEYCNERIEQDDEDVVGDILAIINHRQYGWDGEGGFFPLQWPRYDQRELELVIQMNNYIEENYDIC